MDPKEYLSTYYTNDPATDYEEGFHLHWWQHCYGSIQPKGNMLVVGGGPTIYSLITAAKYVTNICFTDFDSKCLDVVSEWISTDSSFWNLYVRRALEFESLPSGEKSVQERVQLIKDKIACLSQVNILETQLPERYDVVDAHFVLDCMSSSPVVFATALKNSCQVLKHSGLFQGGFLNRTHQWKSGSEYIDCVYLTEETICKMFKENGLQVKKTATLNLGSDDRTRGYIFIQAIKLS